MIHIIDCGSTKTAEFTHILTSLNIPNKIISMNNIHLTNPSAIIISGAPILLSQVDKEPYLKKFQFLKNLTIPVLGVCFGHQIIGLLHGAEISKDQEARDLQPLSILTRNPLFKNIPQNPHFKEDHCENITLPTNFTLLANSQTSKNETMFYKNFFGVQFHPEVSGENGKVFLKNFIDLCLHNP